MSIIERAAEKLRASQKGGEENHSEVAVGDPSRRGSPRMPTPELFGERVLGGEAELPGAASSTGPEEGRRPAVHIDLSRLQAAGLLPPESSREQLEGEFRRMKRPLLANITGRGVVKVDRGESIMVTSALPGEGKTFTAFNLARSLAQEPDWEVVLVDGDNVRQSLTRMLGLESSKGLMDVLSQSDDPHVEDVVLQTDIPRLMFVPAGTRHALATEYLSSKHTSLVLDSLAAKRNRVLLFDAPPLLGAPESLVLSEVVGQIIMVVKAGSTERKAVAAALQPLDRRKAINFLLNQVVRAYGDSYGGFRYGYGYDAEPHPSSNRRPRTDTDGPGRE